MFSPEFLTYIIIIGIGLTIGMLNYSNSGSFNFITILLGITLVCEIVSRILAYRIANSSPPYHFLIPIQSLMWGAFFAAQFKAGWKRKFAVYVCGLLLLLSIANTLFLQGIYKFPDNVLKIQTFGFITIGFFLFTEKLDDSLGRNIFKDPVFLLAVAIIWFNLISFLFFNFHGFLLKNLVPRNTLRIINYTSNYVYYTIILISLCLIFFRKIETVPNESK